MLLAALTPPGWAASVTVRDGRILEGKIGMVAGVAEDPKNPTTSGGVDVQPILVVDDGLRRTFVSKRLLTAVNEAASPAIESIRIPQRVATSGAKIGGVGPILEIQPWDEFGRRTFTMATHKGPLPIIQGITEITPTYTKVEGLQNRRSHVWEMRIATSSIPRDTLSKIFENYLDLNSPAERLRVVRLYIQSERYQDARKELELVVGDGPGPDELAGEVRALRQMGARTLLREIEQRAKAGQYAFVETLLANFPSENVAGETLERVRQIQAEQKAQRDDGARVLKLFDEQLATLTEQPQLKQRLTEFRAELKADLNYDTLDRMAAFLRLSADKTLTAEQKLALAVSGWLLGANQAEVNLLEALSLYDVRDLVYEYLREPVKQKLPEVLEKLRAEEGASVANVAKLLARMKPPIESDGDEAPQATPGMFELSIPSIDAEPDVDYYVQLPPEYDPLRKYPTVVTLNGSGSTAEQQIDWWAGEYSPERKMRLGQATRHGYIVVAVEWRKKHQLSYQYSGREHHAVLASLRDAIRRFSIDTDRVFLSGHSVGGDAAWDIGLAHPDLWAGVLPIVAIAEKYCAHYWENAEHLPFYIVAGEMDGDKMARNSRETDRYLRRGYDATLVEYLGRGHEHFHDEIQRMFDWMNRRERNFFPREIECASMRLWDNYFWWVELGGYPERLVVDPANWPPTRGTRAAKVTGSVNRASVNVKSATDRVTIWLAPELVDFEQRLTISINGRRVSGDGLIKPDLKTLLDDVRGRGDRQHPFWAKVEGP
jgi:predicted esterase